MEKKIVVTGVDRNHQRGATLLSPEDREKFKELAANLQVEMGMQRNRKRS